jgi:tetratricopeptide (TPR) repeat protein
MITVGIVRQMTLSLVCALTLWAAHAIAQQAEVDVLLTQATLAYDDEEYNKALQLLDRVIASEPNNARAHYYRGLVFLAQKQPERAVQAFEKAHAIQPRDLFTRYQLGATYFLLKEYDKANPLLSGVYAEQPKLEAVGFYVGVLRYQQRSYSEAVTAFSQVQTTDPQMRQLIGFYKGLTLGTLGLSEQAVAELDDVLKVQSSDPFVAPVRRMRNSLTTTQSMERRFRATLGFGGFYSDNVALNPTRSNDPFAESLRTRSTPSPGLLMTAHGEYSWLRRGPWESTVSYNFFQTVNLNDGLSRFNVQDHQGAAAGFYRGTVRSMPYQIGLSYAYDYLFLGQDGFLSRHTPALTGTLVQSARHMTTALFRFQDKTFFREPDDRFPALQRDALNWMGGFTHTFRFQEDRHLLSLGYQYDVEDAAGSDFSYAGHRVVAGGVVALPWASTPWGPTRLRYDYQVHWRDYRSLNLLFPQFAQGTIRREDIEQIHFARLEQPLPYNVVVSFQYQRIQNDSNLAVYDFTQNIFYLVTTWTY